MFDFSSMPDLSHIGLVYALRMEGCSKTYVGSSLEPRRRFRTHQRDLRNQTHTCDELQETWEALGKPSLSCFVLECVVVRDPSDLERAEMRWIGRIGDVFNGYRPHPTKRYKVSPASLAKRRATTGGFLSEQTKALLRQANLGKKASAATKAKMSAAHKGRVPNGRLKWTTEQIAQRTATRRDRFEARKRAVSVMT